MAGVAHRPDGRAARDGAAVASPMAPSPLGGPIEMDPPGPPEYRCGHSLTCGRDGRRESALGSSSNPWRVVQTGDRGLGADSVATPPPTASSALPNVANVPGQSRRSPRLDGLLHGPDPHRTRPVRLRTARAPPPTSRPPGDHGPSDGRVDGAADH